MENFFNIGVMGLLGSAAGGFLGAAFGGLVAFIFTGFAILIGIAVLLGSGDATFLNLIGLGPFFGPHISFAGGVAAAAYAAQKGWLESGRDIVTPLVSLSKPSVLLVGAAFGAFGYVVQHILASIGSIGPYTDSVALTVVISAVVVRLIYGKTGIIGEHHQGKTGWDKFEICDEHAWLAYQDTFPMAAILGLFVGGLSSWATVELIHAYPETPSVLLLGFAISASSLTFLAVGVLVPATHHITLVSAVAASLFMGSIESDVTVVIIGAIAGLAVAIVGELFARFWLIRGDTHIDPPASSIWPVTTAVILLAAIFQ